jgi:SNF2 family DNA or RNA helicase
MVKTGLILTPTPLVSQWKQELKSKFNMDIPSTDDPGFKSGSKTFWNAPFVIASINQAKSKKNFDDITAREYGMIIVDEAHHLKNRTTLNWKLVNSLKKRFILLLTATPVENNLMELYNLITLLKPGQLETATRFKEKFMTKGDPTDPRNKAVLKELLGQVMIRNTRALAGIDIPPRFAETIRIEPTKAEKTFYERLEALILSLNERQPGKAKMVIKNLLAQAGSSPKAVESTLGRMLENQDYLLEHQQEILAVKNLCRTTLDTPKNKALLKVIKATGEKVIVFVKYRGTLEHLADFLEWNRIQFSLFHGGMNNHQKDEAIETFENKHQVLVTTEIGGEGRNLQFCSRMVNYDLPWNPMKIEQRIGRIHRIGQKKEVQIFNFCAVGSLEDYILDILDRKINMFEMVIGEIDMILGRIRGEKEFGQIIYEIWINSKTEQDRKKSFAGLGAKMKRAKTGYQKTRELDEKLFGDAYEL